MAHKELVIAWLNDAHAMELGIAQVLERHAEEAKDHPHMHAGLATAPGADPSPR